MLQTIILSHENHRRAEITVHGLSIKSVGGQILGKTTYRRGEGHLGLPADLDPKDSHLATRGVEHGSTSAHKRGLQRNPSAGLGEFVMPVANPAP
jgi:hypothetical protein